MKRSYIIGITASILLVCGVALANNGLGSVINNFYGTTNLTQSVETPVIPLGGIPQPLRQDTVEDFTFGSTGLTSTSTVALFSAFDSINVTNCIRYGDEVTVNVDGMQYCYREIDFTDATITPVAFRNPYGETMWLERVGLKLTQVPTTTVSMAVTTSTVGSIASDNLTTLDDGIAATARLMRPFGALRDVSSVVSTATNTIYWLRPTSLSSTSTPADGGSMGIFRTVYAGTLEGTDMRAFPIPIAPDVFINVFATSTKADNNVTITGTGNIFNGKLILLFSFTK